MKKLVKLTDRNSYKATTHLLLTLRLAATDQDLQHLVNFAYTDYSGTFMDRICIEYFAQNFPKNIVVEKSEHGGENAFLFGDVARDFIEYAAEGYALAYADLNFYYNLRAAEVELEDFAQFLHAISDLYLIHIQAYEWLSKHKAGHYKLTAKGVDFGYHELTQELLAAGVISELAQDQENLNLCDIAARYPFRWN